MKTMKKISLMLMAALAMLAVSCDDKNDGGGSGSGNEEVYTTLGTQQSKDNAGNLVVCGTFFHLCEQPFPDSTPAACRIHSHIRDLTFIDRKIHSDVPLYDTRFLCHQKDRVRQTERIQKGVLTPRL